MSLNEKSDKDDNGPASVQLKYASPDLKVVVGKSNPETFHCYGVILASYSQYIDNLLRNDTPQIEFPDIEPHVWKLMIQGVHTSGKQVFTNLKNLVSVLPYYHKYQFTKGLALCDAQLEKMFEWENQGFNMKRGSEDWDLLVQAALLAHQLNRPFLDLARDFVRDLCRLNFRFHPPSFETLLPMIQEDEVLLRFLTALDPEHPTSAEDRKRCVAKECFAESFGMQLNLIHDVDDIVTKFRIRQVEIVGSNSDQVDGSYSARFFNSNERICVGAMVRVFSKYDSLAMRDLGFQVEIAAVDPFGMEWEIAKYKVGDEPKKTVLYHWKGFAGQSSPIPPESGWTVVADANEGLSAPESIRVDYGQPRF